MSSQTAPLRDEGTRTQVVLAGAISGLVSRFCIAPLDVLKIRLQVQYHSLADPLSRPTHVRPPGVFQVASDIFKHEGITGFWKGNIPAEGLYLGYGAVQFFSYRITSQAIDRFSERNNVVISGPVKSFISGAIAGTVATTATYPLDLLRTRFAAQGTEKVYTGLIASVRDITNHEGAIGFFRGLSAGVSQVLPYMGLFFAFYESMKPRLATVELPFGSGDAIAGVAASVLAKTAVFPLDTVRKRLQIQGPTRGRYHGSQRMPEYTRGVSGTLHMILKREGWRGLYRGLTVSLVKSAPASAATMWTYERAMHVLQRAESKDL